MSGTDISEAARSPANTLDRRRRDEENARRRDYMVRKPRFSLLRVIYVLFNVLKLCNGVRIESL